MVRKLAGAWNIIYFKTRDGSVPANDFLDECPASVEAKFLAVLEAVASTPPPQFSGGGMWEAMHGVMAGFYEVRTQGPNREQFRLFCILENGAEEDLGSLGLDGPAIAVITGMRKPVGKLFSDREYARVRELGGRYRQAVPRRIAR